MRWRYQKEKHQKAEFVSASDPALIEKVWWRHKLVQIAGIRTNRTGCVLRVVITTDDKS